MPKKAENFCSTLDDLLPSKLKRPQKVQQGESFETLYGKKKKPVAKIVPIDEPKKKKKRTFGILDGKVKITFADDFKMTDEELLGLK